MKSYFLQALVLAAVLTLSLQPLEAGGLFPQLPKEGSWVEYYMQFHLQGEETTGTLTLRSLGSQQESGEQCRWIEIDVQADDDSRLPVGVVKMLVPEEAFSPNKAITFEVVRGYHRNKDGEVSKFTDLRRAELTFFRQFCWGELDKAKREASDKSLSYQHGQLKLTSKITGETTARLPIGNDANGLKVVTQYKLFPHQQVPFGIAQYEASHVVHAQENQIEASIKLVLTNSGTDAKSALPDRN